MLPVHQKWAIFPSVVKANTTTMLTIAPLERSFLFYEGETYKITVNACEADEPCYHTPVTHQKLTVVAKDGVLTFPFTFGAEQEYSVQLRLDKQRLADFPVYALEEDLFSLRPLRGDLHSHSFRSDGAVDPAALAGHYREQGYDFFALTDHSRYYPGDEIDEAYDGVKMGLLHVPGEEVHTPDTQVHIVHAGGNESVCARYVHEEDTYRLEVDECLARVPESVPEVYRYRYAQALWATDKIHAAGGLAIFPHPYWRPSYAARVFNVNTAFARILLKSGMFDAYELLGAMEQTDCNLSVALWQELAVEGYKIPVVGSSDVHGIENADTFPHLFTVCFATANETGAVLNAIRNGLSVAVEGTGTEYERTYRAFGARRLIAYTHFLMKNYFVPRQRICQGEGVAMRAYLMGDTPAASITMQAEVAELHYRRFFGLEAPLLPSAEIIEFVKKCRERQLAGPEHRSTILHPEVPTRNI